MTDVGQTRTPSKPAKGKERGGNPISRWYRALALFISQILDELRKVVRPTRNELWNYTLVVIVFVAFMMALVSLRWRRIQVSCTASSASLSEPSMR